MCHYKTSWYDTHKHIKQENKTDDRTQAPLAQYQTQAENLCESETCLETRVCAKASAALMFYTQTPAYQQAVHAGGSRFDLSGQPCGEVTEQQAHALKQLEKWRAEAESAVSPGAEPTP